MVPPTRTQVIVGLVAVLLVLGAVGAAMSQGGRPTTGPGGALTVPAPKGGGAAGGFVAAGTDMHQVTVDVGGAVGQPGVYRVPAGGRVLDAIALAGGAAAGADLGGVNRAAPLVDGQQVLVPRRAPLACAGGGGNVAGGAGAAGTASGPVSINSADVAALDALQGIGPVTAAAIVEERRRGGPFESVDDLDRVPGIGATTIEALRDGVTL